MEAVCFNSLLGSLPIRAIRNPVNPSLAVPTGVPLHELECGASPPTGGSRQRDDLGHA
jgi:hypothetical protein